MDSEHGKDEESNVTGRSADPSEMSEAVGHKQPDVGEDEPIAKSEPTEHEQECQPRMRINEKVSVIFTGVIALATVGYLVVTFCQWKAISRANELARRELMLANRAWVYVFDFEKITNPAGEALGIQVLYRNTGRTPALGLRATVGWTRKQALIPVQDNQNAAGPKWTLPPNGKANTIPRLPPEVVRRVLNGNHGGFVYGTLWYEDVFGDTHWSQFCGEIGPRFEIFPACTIHQETSDAQDYAGEWAAHGATPAGRAAN